MAVAASSQAGAGPVPRHVAVIMDGNGRWAEQRSLPRAAGHRAGAKLRAHDHRAVGAPRRRFADAVRVLERELAPAGRRSRRADAAVPRVARSRGRGARRPTACACASSAIARGLPRRWSSAWSRRRSARRPRPAGPRRRRRLRRPLGSRAGRARLAGRRSGGRTLRPGGDRRGGVRAPARERRAASEPDLFIRTGGERRISNFLLWDLAYTELWFTDTLWPDFDAAVFDAALADFAGRQRRFGRDAGTSGRRPDARAACHHRDRHRRRARTGPVRAPPGFAVAGLALLVLAGAWEWSLLAGIERRFPRVAYLAVCAAAMARPLVRDRGIRRHSNARCS